MLQFCVAVNCLGLTSWFVRVLAQVADNSTPPCSNRQPYGDLLYIATVDSDQSGDIIEWYYQRF